MLPHMPRIRAKKASYPRANFPNCYIYTYGAGATARPQPSAKQGKTSSNIFYLVATSMISAVPARTHFAAGALVFNGAEKTYVGPRRKCL